MITMAIVILLITHHSNDHIHDNHTINMYTNNQHSDSYNNRQP